MLNVPKFTNSNGVNIKKSAEEPTNRARTQLEAKILCCHNQFAQIFLLSWRVYYTDLVVF